MTIDPDSYKENGDAIEGDRIACQFRKIDKITLVHATSNHRTQSTKLYTAYCVITKPLRAP
jgi:hypothetical protein